jgi:DNA-binding LacI/PurR family transcriptional regulator
MREAGRGFEERPSRGFSLGGGFAPSWSRGSDLITPTLRDVAELAGVSTSAVSRAFTEGASVSAKTRAKVEEASRTLGYVPSLIARSLATHRTKLIGLVANNFQNPVFLDVFDLYTRALQARGFRPLLVNLSDVVDPSESARLLKQYRVDGVIVATSTLPPEFPTTFRDAGLRIVHAFGRASRRPPVHVVGIDNVAAGRLAARTLLGRGYRRLAFLGGPQEATSTQDRAAGFLKELAEAGVVAPRLGYARAYSYDAGREAIGALLGDRRLEAIFCGDDLIGMGAIDGARAAGQGVPDDMGFLGFNDMAMARWAPYNLTTIRQPIGEIIRRSVELMLELVEGAQMRPDATVFPCSVIERGTLRPAAATASRVRR